MSAQFRGPFQQYSMPQRTVMPQYPPLGSHRAQTLGGQPTVASAVGGAQTGREFDPSDFPALGAPNQPQQSTAQDSHQGPLNGFGQSQDPQHRQNVLGAIASSGQQQQQQQAGLLNIGQRLQQQQQPFASDADKRNYVKLNQANNVATAWNSADSRGQTQPPGFHQNIANGVPSQHHLSQQPHSSALNAPPGLPPGLQGFGQQHQQHSIGSGQPPQHAQFQGASAIPNSSEPHQSPTQQHGAVQQSGLNQPSGLPQTPAQQILISPADRWGLMGLLALIKATDPDVNLLSYGQDLGTMGMDMNASGHISGSFITPWADSSAAHSVEPDFHLPPCYNIHAAPPGPSKAAAFSDETLFFMFYSSPRDQLQEIAAQELYNRAWRFHKEHRLWIIKEHGASPSQKIPGGEVGVYQCFDPENWERQRKQMQVLYSDLEERTPNAPAFQGGGAGALQQQQGFQGQQQQNAGVMGPSQAQALHLQMQQQQQQRGFGLGGMGMAAVAGL
ncbi:hypothetical protein EXIGLDRAFT_759596 [Exidia glandulosa HHB12029]|uniref:NOT2/NOT3/NOT5 C-terminal domain-containing protein n=1 Tax=Exidia glandulosa HHB12029 TaxID=1314781 RepID=A0A165PZT5_EXIGL|nr:hypothetical protein EXIGLDRAFT_759596 [Exidia glandulosa HHB12029]